MKRAFGIALALVAGCSSSSTAQLPTTLPPTTCSTASADPSHSVVLAVSDGTGGLSVRAPNPLLAGMVHLEVDAAAANTAPVTVRLLDGTAEVTVIRGVPPGGVCAVDVDLAAGDYRAVQGDRRVPIVVVDAAPATT